MNTTTPAPEMATPSPSRRKLITLERAAAIIGVPRTAMYRLTDAREIAVVRLMTGKRSRIYITEADLDAFIERHRTPCQAELNEAPVPTPFQLPATFKRRFA